MIWVDWGHGRLTMCSILYKLYMCICSICRINKQQDGLESCEFSVAMIPGVLALICGCRKDLPINPSKTHVTKKRQMCSSQKISTPSMPGTRASPVPLV